MFLCVCVCAHECIGDQVKYCLLEIGDAYVENSLEAYHNSSLQASLWITLGGIYLAKVI